MELKILEGTLIECTSYLLRLINENTDASMIRQQANFCQDVIDKVIAIKLNNLNK